MLKIVFQNLADCKRRFFLIFAAVAVIALLTPWLAKKIDAFREKHAKPAAPEDPRCKAVRGPYDLPEPKKAASPQKKEPEKKPYQPKH